VQNEAKKSLKIKELKFGFWLSGRSGGAACSIREEYVALVTPGPVGESMGGDGDPPLHGREGAGGSLPRGAGDGVARRRPRSPHLNGCFADSSGEQFWAGLGMKTPEGARPSPPGSSKRARVSGHAQCKLRLAPTSMGGYGAPPLHG